MYDYNMVLADYNDEKYDYTKYWEGREYENESEFIALKKLLPEKVDENRSVIDVGGGFGRLLPVLRNKFSEITIFDYSQKLLDTAVDHARDMDISVKTIKGDVNEISALVEGDYDCITMVRVSHHLDDLEKVFYQIKNLLKDDGIFILEVANKVHFKSVISNLFKGNFKYFSTEPISIATKKVTFLNHHPKRVENILNDVGFNIEKRLSVSNFRHPFFKKVLPLKILLLLEFIMQNIGAPLYFGPSIFSKLKKKSRSF
jgi:2-polyprenyl-3-methyl-5-hydroxy-6-metoxy-1,4-benzoquinol methylase